MKKGIIIFIGIIIVCMAAFFVYQSQGEKTNTERQQTEKKQTEPKKEEQKANVNVEKADASIIAKELISNPKEVSLKPGEESSVTLSLKLYDEKTMKENTFNLGVDDVEFLSVKSRNDDVAEANIMKNGQVKIIANESPSQKSTEIEITYRNKKKNRESTVKIPITINNQETNVTQGLEGYWRDENNKKLFVKINQKNAKKIEFQAFDLYEIWYTGDVQFNTFKQKELFGKMKYTQAYAQDGDTPPDEEFTLERVSVNKMIVRKGKDVLNLTKSSKAEFEQAQLVPVGGDQGTNTQPNQDNTTHAKQDNNVKTSQNNKLNGDYYNIQNGDKLLVSALFTMVDDKNATIQVEQRSNNSNGITTSMMGMFTSNAVKQNESTWSFTWVDNFETKGTGTITFQEGNVTLDLKGNRNGIEGRGVITQNVKLKKD
ncbi:hypothetical protein IRV08_20445 [Bacillus cereus]|uniref:hypothetical protein n=2 Tax=Bacillus TaxID=1386 RepID=UPI00094469D4|nr:hypothetical protein [Bacillus cereus group sp. BfR-BA-01350]MBL3822039.1 hypothetical protein [Bacillus cereus]MDA1884751.1 hypothetical protein [Bacillus cereus group sp. BY105LC]